MSDVFVSYKRDDLATVSRLVEALRAHGLEVWWDRDIAPSAPWEQTIEHELSVARVVIVAWSPAAIASENVKAEARWARQQGRLLQVFIETCEPPLFFGERQGLDLRGWSGAASDPAFRALLGAVRNGLSAPPTPGRGDTPQAGERTPASDRSSSTVAPRVDGEALLRSGMVLNGLFEVRRFVGRGDFAEVYEGVNLTTDERVAIKAFQPKITETPAMREAFLREMRLLTRLGHPAIAAYRMAAREPAHGVLYVVHDFVDGIQLDTLIGQVSVPESKLCALTGRLAEALKHAHGLGVIHRKLTPENVIVPGGRLDDCKIIDFGVSEHLVEPSSAPLARTGRDYAAPEQFEAFGGGVGPWTDVYSLGRVVLSLATGSRPDEGDPDISRAPRGLRPLFTAMLAPDPQTRCRSMDEVLLALDRKSGRSHV